MELRRPIQRYYEGPRRSRARVWWYIAAFLFTVGISAVNAGGQEEPARTLADLRYREALFHLYVHDHQAALVTLAVYQQRGQLPRSDENELLTGMLYSALGIEAEAEQRFQQLLKREAAAEIHDLAWYHLGQIYARRGDKDAAARALVRITAPLPPPLEQEKNVLLAEAYIARGEFQKAQRAIRAIDRTSADYLYAQYNLATAHTRQGNQREAQRLLQRIARGAAPSDEIAALRDKASLVLGYFQLKKRPAKAMAHFKRVRLDGPFSNRALLGLGWSYAAQERHAQALAPWRELRERDPLDRAVQESLLVMPYTFAKLQANRQALQYYSDAIGAYKTLYARTESALERVQTGAFLRALMPEIGLNDAGVSWQLRNTVAAEGTFYVKLLEDREFRREFTTLRDLRALAQQLNAWARKLDVYGSLTNAQQARTTTGAGSASPARVSSIAERHAKLESRLRQLLQRTRRGANESELQNIDTTMSGIHARWQRMQQLQAPASGAIERIATLQRRLADLQSRRAAIEAAQEHSVSQLAALRLEDQKQTLAAYLIQARYAVARIYDQAESGTEAQ